MPTEPERPKGTDFEPAISTQAGTTGSDTGRENQGITTARDPGITNPWDEAASSIGSVGSAEIEDPNALKEAGMGAQQLAGEIKTRGDSGWTSLSLAAQSFRDELWGGDLWEAILGTSEIWEYQVEDLKNTCLRLHQNCVSTADNYAKTESANTSQMKSLSEFD